MYNTLVGFAEELRRIQIPVSLTEVIDASQAVESTFLADREDLRAALSATMVKHSEHLEAFDIAFDVFFGHVRTGPDHGRADGSADHPVDAFDDITDEYLRDVLIQALGADNRLILRRLSETIVTRYADIEPGRAVAGRLYLFRALRAIDLDGVTKALVAALDDGDRPPDALERRVLADRIIGTNEYLRTEIEAEIRRRLVADRGADAVAPLVRPTLPQAIGFMNASSAEMIVMRRTVAPLARKLAVHLARQRRLGRRGDLDFRRTFRISLSTGGVPVQLRFKPPTNRKPEIVVIADVSGSVATFAKFTLELLYAMRLQFNKLRVFAFIDNLVEVTDILKESITAEQAFAAISADPRLIWIDGRSDYGHALELFAGNYRTAVTPRTTVLVLGDARNNYRAAEEHRLSEIAHQAHNVFWLNPEREANWNTGDSVLRLYAPYCKRVVECANLAQLRDFADSLAV